MHRCDTPRCLNVDHLFVGTQADNVADKMAKGRHRSLPGERHPMAKLSAAQVSDIRRSFAEGAQKRHLAAEFGVTRQCIHLIVTGRSWGTTI